MGKMAGIASSLPHFYLYSPPYQIGWSLYCIAVESYDMFTMTTYHIYIRRQHLLFSLRSCGLRGCFPRLDEEVKILEKR